MRIETPRSMKLVVAKKRGEPDQRCAFDLDARGQRNMNAFKAMWSAKGYECEEKPYRTGEKISRSI